MNARQSFWIMRVHQSPAFSLIFHIFSCVNYAIVDRDRQGVTGDGFGLIDIPFILLFQLGELDLT